MAGDGSENTLRHLESTPWNNAACNNWVRSTSASMFWKAAAEGNIPLLTTLVTSPEGDTDYRHELGVACDAMTCNNRPSDGIHGGVDPLMTPTNLY